METKYIYIESNVAGWFLLITDIETVFKQNPVPYGILRVFICVQPVFSTILLLSTTYYVRRR